MHSQESCFLSSHYYQLSVWGIYAFRHTPLVSILTVCLTAHLAAYAEDMDMSKMEMDSSSNTHSAAIEAVGVVNDINEAKGIVTISYEAIKSLSWPSMTMHFTILDTKLFRKLGNGKKINFAFIQQKGRYIVTEIK